jgi:Holliday junction resolvase-like predicted endonuclease
MPGHTFELYVARLMEYQGYKTLMTKSSGDLGVDIIAQKRTFDTPFNASVMGAIFQALRLVMRSRENSTTNVHRQWLLLISRLYLD